MNNQAPVRGIKAPSLRSFAMGRLLLAFLIFQISVQAQVKQLKEVRRVLIFNELGPWSPAISVINDEIFAALEKSPYQLEFYVEHLDTSLFSDEVSQRQFRDWYFQKYRNRKPDLIMAIGPSARAFMSNSHQVFSPGTPIIFWENSEETVGPPQLDPEFTGVWAVTYPAKTLEVALRLQPGTKHVVVDGGASPFDRQVMALARQRLREYESKLDFTYLTDLPMSVLLERLKHLPSATVVLHVCLLQDAAGQRFIDATESVPMIAGAANAPVFVMDDLETNGGAVGGYVYANSLTGKTIGGMAVRILSGEKPQDIPIVRIPGVYMFDRLALQKWGLKESNIPPGSTILNWEPTIWEAYRPYLFGGVSLIIVEAILIFGLLWHRSRLKEAKTELASAFEATQESEQRFRLVANTAPVMIWMSGPDKRFTYFNQPWLDFTGRTIEAELGSGWAEGVHPSDLLTCLNTYEGAFDRHEAFKMEYRLRRQDREYRWVFDLGVPRFHSDGSFAGYIGSCLDVTDRKLAEEALAGMGRKLIEAHEEERTWIARELHDDVNQRIALLAIELEQWEQRLPECGLKTSGEIRHIHQGLFDLGRDIQSLSHRLHSSKLDYLGIVAAARSFCKELSEQKKVEIDFVHSGIPGSLPNEVSLCLFRVLQEALQNAVKHSGERHFKVDLRGSSGEIQLTVSDLGVGFEQEDVIRREGLGLISMRERLQLVSGDFSIKSQPGNGTTISARVPIETEQARTSAAV